MMKYNVRTARPGYSVIGFLIFISLIFSFGLRAQDFQRQYKMARQLFDEQKYSLAMEAFKPLIVYDANNPYPEYASFFYALSAYHQGYQALAKETLLQTKKLYPKWSQLDEMNLWLARIYFDQRQYFQGLVVLKSIRSGSYKNDIEALQRKYLAQIDDVETLKMILEDNPDNAIAGYYLAQAVSRQPIYQQDVQLFETLVTRFKLNRDEFAVDIKPVSVKKDQYRVALLFPFLAKTFEPTVGVKANQFVVDLYEGMRMAADTLAKQGIQINLLAYDTERNPDVLKKLLETDELKSVDLIVGPLSVDELELARDFSMENKISIVNPVSNNSAFVGANPLGMLFQPSYETLGAKSAEWAAHKVKNKNCLVFYGDTPRDSTMASNFVKKAGESGMKVVLAERITGDNLTSIQQTLATPTGFDEYKNPKNFKLKRDSIGTIYVASDNALIYSKVISSVEARKDSIVIMGTEQWASPDNLAINYDNFERLRITIPSPNFVDLSNPVYIAFRKKYIAKHSQIPSLYARTGYEFVNFVGKALYQYGTYFQEGISQAGFQPGLLYSGIDFTNARDNQLVPFVRMKDGEFVRLKLN